MKGDSTAAALLRSLCGVDPEEVLARIFDGDPLQLQGLVMRVLRGNGFLLDPDRCMQHSLEEIAFTVSGADEVDAKEIDRVWIERCVDRACDRLIALDEAAERRWTQGFEVQAGTHRFLSEAFGVRWGRGRAASVAFHRLPLRTRLVFFAICVERTPAERWLEATDGSPAELRDDVWMAFEALGFVTDNDVAEFRARG